MRCYRDEENFLLNRDVIGGGSQRFIITYWKRIDRMLDIDLRFGGRKEVYKPKHKYLTTNNLEKWQWSSTHLSCKCRGYAEFDVWTDSTRSLCFRVATLRMIETRGAEGVGIMILKNCTLMHTCLILPIDFVQLQLTIFTLIGSVTAFYNFYNFNYK